jgi:hypothetical protein
LIGRIQIRPGTFRALPKYERNERMIRDRTNALVLRRASSPISSSMRAAFGPAIREYTTMRFSLGRVARATAHTLSGMRINVFCNRAVSVDDTAFQTAAAGVRLIASYENIRLKKLTICW